MAEIFRARTEGPSDFSKEVAIKKILPSLAHNEDFITQFLDEARIAGCLNHPNIVNIFDVGQVEDSYYIAMEYVHCRHLGQTVRRVLDTVQTFPFQESAAIINEVAKALSYAHTALDTYGQPLGVIHRDVSPQNILLSFNGAIKLTDFGIAKATNKLYQTTVGVIKGKFSYLAPEQLKGDSSSPRSDLFALGVVFWEVLSGRRLFLGQSDLATIRLVQSCEIPPIREIRPDIPEELEQILNTLLSPDPTFRYQTAQDVSRDLEYYLSMAGPGGMGMIAQFMRQLFPEMAPMQSQELIPAQRPEELTNPGYVRPRSIHDSQENEEELASAPTLFEGEAISEQEGGLPPQVDLSEEELEAPSLDVGATLLDQKAIDFSDLLEVARNSGIPPTESLETFEKLTAPIESSALASYSMQTAFQTPSENTFPPTEALEAQGNWDSTLNEPASTNSIYQEEYLNEDPPTQPNALDAVVDTQPTSTRKSSKTGLLIFFILLLFLGGGGAAAWYFQGLWRPILTKWLPKQGPPIIKDKAPVLTLRLFPGDTLVFANNAPLQGSGGQRQNKLVAGKTYKLEFRKKGYTTQKRIIMPEEGDEIKLQVKLKPKSGVLNTSPQKRPKTPVPQKQPASKKQQSPTQDKTAPAGKGREIPPTNPKAVDTKLPSKKAPAPSSGKASKPKTVKNP